MIYKKLQDLMISTLGMGAMRLPVVDTDDARIDAYLDEKHGIFAYLMKQKERGRIRHLGFSAHGSMDVMKRFLAAYGEHMEFCQIQLNYVDWTLQEAKEKAALLNKHHIPIWVMEVKLAGQHMGSA